MILQGNSIFHIHRWKTNTQIRGKQRVFISIRVIIVIELAEECAAWLHSIKSLILLLLLPSPHQPALPTHSSTSYSISILVHLHSFSVRLSSLHLPTSSLCFCLPDCAYRPTAWLSDWWFDDKSACFPLSTCLLQQTSKSGCLWVVLLSLSMFCLPTIIAF